MWGSSVQNEPYDGGQGDRGVADGRGCRGAQLTEKEVAQDGELLALSRWAAPAHRRHGHSHMHTGTHRDPPTQVHTDPIAPEEALKRPDNAHTPTPTT